MPKKIREIKTILLKAGFTYTPAKGSHTKWIHPQLSQSIIIAGKDGDGAKQYLEEQVNQAINQLKQVNEKEIKE